MDTKKQISVFAMLMLVYAFLVFAAYAWLPMSQINPTGASMPPELQKYPGWQLGLINAGIFLALYSLLGLAGFWLQRRLGLPGIYRQGAGWRSWLAIPLLVGVMCGVALVLVDFWLVARGGFSGFAHPPFPMSIIASATAGIGEEVLFRLFVMGMWAFLLNLVFKRWNQNRAALWIANLVAGLAFAAAHFPAAMMLTGAASIAQIPPQVTAEVILLNTLIGVVAGWRMLKDGLVAAAGVHFWTDIVWHVLYPLLG